jgi:hypothetical protein
MWRFRIRPKTEYKENIETISEEVEIKRDRRGKMNYCKWSSIFKFLWQLQLVFESIILSPSKLLDTTNTFWLFSEIY